MKWIDSFWTAYDFAVNTVINTTIYCLNGVGTIACVAGGVAFPLSFAMDDTLTASYSGSAHTIGKVNLGVTVQEFNYSLNGSIPFHDYRAKDDGLTYHLQEYIDPATVQIASAILCTSGITLKALSASLKLWQQHRIDKKTFQSQHRIDPISPGGIEYLYVTGESFCDSLSYTLLTSTVTGLLIQYTGIIGSSMHFTYPPVGQGQVNTTHYQGPVDSSLIPVSYSLEQNSTITLPVFNMNVSAEEHVEALATINATYGGGLFLKSNNTTNFPSAIPAVIGVITYNSSRFFSQKATETRDKRLQDARDYGYSLVN